MLADDLREFLNLRPIRPIRITLTDGRIYEVPHPELVLVGFSVAILYIPKQDAGGARSERSVTIALSHVMQLEHVEDIND